LRTLPIRSRIVELVDNLQERHARRLSRLDPLLPDSGPPEAGPDGVELDVPGGRGLARVIRANPDTLESTWHPAERHVLVARVGEDEPAAVLDALLSRWSDSVRTRAVDADSAAELTWPSPDVELTPTLSAHGLAPHGRSRAAGCRRRRGVGPARPRRAGPGRIRRHAAALPGG
jgi:hypothetical protein